MLPPLPPRALMLAFSADPTTPQLNSNFWRRENLPLHGPSWPSVSLPWSALPPLVYLYLSLLSIRGHGKYSPTPTIPTPLLQLRSPD